MSPSDPAGAGDERIKSAIAFILRGGLLVSVGLLLAGVVLTAAGSGPPVPAAVSLGDIPGALGRFEPKGYFSLGLLVLVATPGVQVLALLCGFVRAGRWLPAGCSLVILAALALSAALGLIG